VLKMLTFVDAIIAAAARPNDRSGQCHYLMTSSRY
jgi:hypothetical protein